MRFTIFQESRKGSRKINQDRVAYTFSRDTLLLVVADGMGGHAGGEIAAQICTRLYIERFQQEAKPVLRNPLKFLQDTMMRAHAALGSYANQFSMLETPRTTCVACIVQAGNAYWAHAGDSRLYLYRQGALIGQTKDHSKVQYLVDQGIIDPREAGTHPDRNKVFSCLGGMVDPVIDLSRRTPLRNGDILVLCTDGLWSVLGKEEIATWLTSTPILKSSPLMLREAEKRGGPDGDNLSAIVVRWGPETLTDEPSTITETHGPRRVRDAARSHADPCRTQGRAARPLRRRDRARDRGDTVHDPALSQVAARRRHFRSGAVDGMCTACAQPVESVVHDPPAAAKRNTPRADSQPATRGHACHRRAPRVECSRRRCREPACARSSSTPRPRASIRSRATESSRSPRSKS